jgi:hypothetical protein
MEEADLSRPTEKPKWGEITKDKVLLLSLVGSLASVAALAITLLDKVALNQQLMPQLAAWRVIFLLVSFLCIGSTLVFTYLWALPAFNNHNLSPPRRIFEGTWRCVVGLIVVGVFLDGLYGAMYWTPWMYTFFGFLITLALQLF